MKRITFLTVAFLCLFGLIESLAQNTYSYKDMEQLDLTEERQGKS